MMIDLVVAALLLGLVLRGWFRGFVREAIDVGTLILGAVIAFRFASIVGRLVTSTFGVTSDMARIIGGTVLFLGISIGAGVVASMIHRTMRRLPGLTLLNRLGGAGLGAVYALVLATIALTLAAAVSTPEPVASQLRESVAAQRLTGPEGPAQRMLSAAAGDRVISSMVWLQGFVGRWSVESSHDEPIVVPAVPDSGVTHPSVAAADDVFAALNDERAAAGLAPLAWSDDLALVAVNRAGGVYRSGSSDGAPPVAERLVSVGVVSTMSDEQLVLAASPDGVRRAIMASDGHRAALLTEGYREVGIGVVEGPYGLMAVQVYSG
jgi:uncharacterized protein YkwD